MTSEKPNPELIFDALNAYQKSATLSGAIELDLFTGVGEGKNTVSQLAEYCKATAKGIRVLCDFMVIQGFLGKDDGHYLLTPISAAFLDRKSPSYLGSIVRFLKQPSIEGAFQDVASLVRKGGTLLPGQDGRGEQSHLGRICQKHGTIGSPDGPVCSSQVS
ncbi:MAG: methyltransferase dimerization domain-containing protein [Terriglobia bacterium]